MARPAWGRIGKLADASLVPHGSLLSTSLLSTGHRWLAATIGLAAVLAVPAAAQIVPTKQAAPQVRDSDDGPLRSSGGLPGLGGYPGRGLSLSGTFLTRYEDNISRQPVADAGLRIRPQLDAAYGLALGRQGLYVQGSVARDMFFGTDVLPDRDRYAAGAGLAYQLSRCSGEAGASWQRSLAFLTDAIAFGGFQQERTNFGVSANCRIGGSLSLQGSVTRQLLETEQGVSNAFNFSSWSYSAGFGFGSAALGQFSLNGSITDSAMPGRLVITPTGFAEDGLLQRNVRFGYQRKFGSRINISAGVSYIETQPSLPETIVIIDGVAQLVPRDGFSGLGFDAGLDLALSPRLSIDLTTTRSTFVNPVVGAQFTVFTAYAGAVRYRLNDRYTVAVGASRRENSYRGGFVSELQPFLRVSDTVDRFYGQFSASLGRRLRVALDLSHNRRRSNPAIGNFNSTGLGLNLGFDFGRSR
jgi:hypothetical protein